MKGEAIGSDWSEVFPYKSWAVFGEDVFQDGKLLWNSTKTVTFQSAMRGCVGHFRASGHAGLFRLDYAS